ncbi:MAG TPA: tRNA (N6-isopentenyl adenosine(37)-C2)-methylthiotransferase MiaB [Vicinamibacterales bacterium]|nr:tRNA (N6-isopentenyl adenosine(37)-C2)-methylthiotransferase MiaB [Vicinamibacterales bacterium]
MPARQNAAPAEAVVARKYFVQTFGCQMNYHDSERIAGLLERDGLVASDSAADADVVVINTCSVRERAEDKLYTELGEVRELSRENGRDPIVVVAGCVAQQEGERLLKRDASIDVIVGTQSLKQMPALIARAEARRQPAIDVQPYDDVSFPLGVARPSDPARAWVTIIEGCNEFCSFCVVPYTRGHERMRPVADILAEVDAAAASGRCEVQLLGQIVNHYQAPDDPGCDFAELLRRVASVPGIRRVRFASPHPRHVTDRLIDAMRDVPGICRHLHLPVQSGSNRILKVMRRRYTREEYLELLARLRDRLPGIALSTDMIVGFPGETGEDFDLTLDLVRQARYHSMFSFKYSARPGTLAGKRYPDDVPEIVKTERIVALQRLQAQTQAELFAGMVGEVHEVLVDGVSRRRAWEVSGRTSGNSVVNLAGPADWIGRIMPVRITGHGPNSLRGEAIAREVSGEPAHAR